MGEEEEAWGLHKLSLSHTCRHSSSLTRGPSSHDPFLFLNLSEMGILPLLCGTLLHITPDCKPPSTKWP